MCVCARACLCVCVCACVRACVHACVRVCVFLFVYLPPRLLITSGVIWIPYHKTSSTAFVWQLQSLSVVARCGLRIEARCRN